MKCLLHLNVKWTFFVHVREWIICISRCFNHTVTCPVLIVMWTVDGFLRSLDSHCIRSEWKTAQSRLYIDTFLISQTYNDNIS